jgi:hypothetical protein
MIGRWYSIKELLFHNFKNMFSVEEALHFMKSKGFPFVYEWEDDPGTVYGEHFHRDKMALYTLSGSVEFYFFETSEIKILQA